MTIEEQNKKYRNALETIRKMVPRFYGINTLRQFKEEVDKLAKATLQDTKDNSNDN